LLQSQEAFGNSKTEDVVEPDRTVRSPLARSNVAKLGRDHDGTVHSLLRALSLLEVLAEDDDGYRLVDLAQRTGLSTSTVHRLLTTLEQKRFVQFDRDGNLWHIGVQCFAVGAVFGRRRNIAQLALPIMRRLRDTGGETVNLGLADQGDVIFLTQVESRETMRAMGRPGGRSPMTCTALGRAILAAMDDQAIAEIVQKHGLPRMTPNSIARPTRLHEVLVAVRRTGYAVDDQENSVGLRCVAAVIRNEFSVPIAALSVAGPTTRVTLPRVPEIGALVQVAASEITRAIGGRPTARKP
jgi:IclR family acetate operon transcriptional repressor